MISTLQKIIADHPAAIVVADPSSFDCPLVAVNSSFERMTGYQRSEVIGRNCRFLQTDETDQAEVGRIRRAIAERDYVETCILNRRADGSLFHNFLIISPIWRGDSRTYLLGCQYELALEAQTPDKLLNHREVLVNDPGLSEWSSSGFRKAARLQSRDAEATRRMLTDYLSRAA